jgi:branched-chain amino acid transport system substrate-binding protein
MKSKIQGLALTTALAAGLAGAAHAEEFLVGAELPLTGTLARVGAGMQEGIMVAAEVFNKYQRQAQDQNRHCR